MTKKREEIGFKALGRAEEVGKGERKQEEKERYRLLGGDCQACRSAVGQQERARVHMGRRALIFRCGTLRRQKNVSFG